MIARLRDTGERWLLGFWLALPLLGHLTAPFYILSAPFCRNRSGRVPPALAAFCALCAAYVAWIAFVSLRAGPAREAWEPIGDAGSLLIAAGIAAYVLRGARPLDMGRVYRGSVIVLIAVCALAAFAHFGFGIHRPGLLMKNPLNLSPLLIVPALICTLAAHAPSRRWQAAGVLAFFLAAVTLLLILQARGSALVLVGLALFRVGWILALEPAPLRQRARDAAGIVAALGLALGLAALDAQVAQRFGVPGGVPAVSPPSTPESAPAAVQTAAGPAPPQAPASMQATPGDTPPSGGTPAIGAAPDAIASRTAPAPQTAPAVQAETAPPARPEDPAAGAGMAPPNGTPPDGTLLSETPADDTLPGGTPLSGTPPAATQGAARQAPDGSAAVSSPPPSETAPRVAPKAAPAQASTPPPAVPDSSIAQRLAMLAAGGQAFLEAPWLGHGGQNRFEAARPYLPEGFPDFSHLHNDFLTHAVAGGLPAVALLCLILAFPLLIALRAPTRDRLHTALLFSGAFTGTALTNNVLFVDISAFALALNAAIAIMMVSDPPSPCSGRQPGA